MLNTDLFNLVKLSPALQKLLQTTFLACTQIAARLQQPINTFDNQPSSINSTGDQQQAMDVVANDLIKQSLLEGQCALALSSEEEDDAVAINPLEKYVIAFDPLDGSSNLNVGVNVGTIFSILPRIDDINNHPIPSNVDSNIINDSLLQPGQHQVVAGYVMYGSCPSFTIAVNTPEQRGVFMGSLNRQSFNQRGDHSPYWQVEYSNALGSRQELHSVVKPLNNMPDHLEVAVNIGNFPQLASADAGICHQSFSKW